MRSWRHTPTAAHALLLAVAAALAVDAADAFATTGSTPPPCAADGTCRPNRREWGWYHTHWRPWPGEQVGLMPDPAAAVEGEEEGGLPGLVLPDPAKEDQAGAERTEPRPGPPAPDGAGPPGPAEEGDVGPAGEAPGVPPGVEPPAGDLPPIDPFGYHGEPQDPTARLTLPAANGVALRPPSAALHGDDPPPMPSFVQPLPTVLPAESAVQPALSVEPARNVEPAVNVQPAPAPNMQGEDAPPALPASLLNAARGHGSPASIAGTAASRPLAPQQTARTVAPLPPVELGQPTSLRPAAPSQIQPVSWQTPGGIALVNPAGAVTVEPGADGAQQAIYYEVSDEPAVIAQ